MYCALHPSCIVVAIFLAFSAPLRFLYLPLDIFPPAHLLFVACTQRENSGVEVLIAFRPPLGPFFAHRLGVTSAASVFPNS